MSTVQSSPFHKPRCGDVYPLGNPVALPLDLFGSPSGIQIVGTDPDVDQPIDGGSMTEDYSPGITESTVNPGYSRVNPYDGTFYICIEQDAATYAIVLHDGTQFTITPAQSTAYLGQWYPAKIRAVLMTGTTGYFSVGY